MRKLIRVGIWLVIIGGLVYLTACTGTLVTSKFANYLKDFEKDTDTVTKGVEIYFTDLPSPTVGRCYPGLKLIQIDKEAFEKMSPIEKKALVYHELGHCVCNIFKHAKESLFCGTSLMTPSMLGRYCYENFWNEYMVDLRKRCK